ncbi:hypothetical protein Tco_1217277 [Tanacetum coccineum]
MTTPIVTSTIDSQMHNIIMGSLVQRDRPPMLATGRFAHGDHEFLRYMITRPNGDALRKCILKGTYTLTKRSDSFVVDGMEMKYTQLLMHVRQSRNGGAIERLLQGGEITQYLDVTEKLILGGRIKDMQENLALIAKYFKKRFKPSKQQLRTFSNTRNKECGYLHQGTRMTSDLNSLESEGSDMLNPKGVNDSTYHRKRCAVCKKLRKLFNFQAEQSDWLADTDEEIDEQELEAHYSYMATISGKRVISNVTLDLPDVCDNDIQDAPNDVGIVKEKHDELVKRSLLTKSHYEGLVKEKTKVITDLKLKEEKDIDKMISMENQLKFLNEIVYKRSQSIQTIHMLAPKCPTFNGRHTFANPSKSRQAYNVMTNNINHLKEIVDQAWVKHSNDLLHLRNPTAQDMENPIKTCLMPLALKTQNDSFAFVHELKQEMHMQIYLKYVESLEDELDELESDKAEFSNMYDMLLQECVSKDVMCSYLQSSSDLDEITELQCLYLHKVRECDCLAQKLSEQTEFVSKEIYTKLLWSFAKLEKHSISLEIALQECQEQLKNDTVCKEKASNVFRKEREQYFEIQDLKAQLQDKNIAISELKKLIEKCKGKSVDTKFDKPSVVRQPNAQRILKPSVLEKRLHFQTL